MSLGCPTIISAAEVLREVSDGNSLVFEPYDHNQLADHILALAKNLELAEQLAESGLRRAREFTWESAAEQTLAIYSQVLENASK